MMKAWTMKDKSNSVDPEIMYAETANKAKYQTRTDNSISCDTPWTDLRPTRFPQLDDTKNLDSLDRTLLLVSKYGWFWIFDGVFYTESNIDDMKKIIETIKKEEKDIG